MTKQEFSKALALAKTGNYKGSTEMFLGFALASFNKVTVTLDDVAALIAYQCFYFGGGIDNEALNEVYANKNKFLVV